MSGFQRDRTLVRADHGDAGAVRDSWDGAAQRIMTLARYTFDTRAFPIALGGEPSVT